MTSWFKQSSRQESDIKRRVHRIAEDEAIALHRAQHMSPSDIIHYYTGRRQPQAELSDAIDAIVRFNMDVIHHRGFAAV